MGRKLFWDESYQDETHWDKSDLGRNLLWDETYLGRKVLGMEITLGRKVFGTESTLGRAISIPCDLLQVQGMPVMPKIIFFAMQAR